MSVNKNFVKLFSLLFFIQSYLFANIRIEPLPKGVSVFCLDNGLEVLLIENPALPMIGVNTVVKVGSAYETFSTSGMSHMLEHLLFNGTSTMTQRELYDAVDKIGGYNNANTSEYYTNFMMVTPADKIKEGMKIQAAMLFDSVLPNEKFEKEKGIVLEEIAKSLANGNEQLYRNEIDVLYKGHALSLPTLGTYETIRNMNRDYVYNFYKNYYVPNNMLMSVIGKFNTNEMIALIKEIYGKKAPGIVRKTNRSEWATGFQAPMISKINNVNNRYYKGDKTHLQLYYGVNNHSAAFFDLLAISLKKIKSDFEKTLQKKFPNEIVSVDFSTLNNPVKSYIGIDLTLNDETSINTIAQYSNKQIKKYDLSLSSKTIESEAIKSETAFLKQIEKPHMFGIYNADKIAKEGFEAILNSFSGNEILAAGKILKTFKITNSPQIIIQHPFVDNNGIQVKIKTKLFKNDKKSAAVIAKQNSASNLLAVHYLFKYKAEHERKYGNDIAKKWHKAFGNRMQTSEKKKEYSKYGLTFVVNDNPFIPMDNIYLSPTFGYIRVEGLASDIKGAIEFLNKEIMNFLPTKEEFNNVNKEGMPFMADRKNKAKEKFDRAYETLILQPVIDTRNIKILDYNAFLQFGKEYFTPNNIIVSVVSKENPDTINSYFSEFNSTTENPFTGLAKERGFKKWNEPKTIEENGGGEQSYTFFGFVKNYENKDKAALTILSLMLRDDIIFNIREKQGLAYRMLCGIKMVGNKALFYVEVPTQPQNVEKLVPQFPKLFTPEFANKITEEELTKTINMYLGKMMFRRLSSINQAYYLAHSLYYDGNIKSDEENLHALKKVKLSDVQKTARKYLIIKNPVQIIIH